MGSIVQGSSCLLCSPVYTPVGLLLPLNLPSPVQNIMARNTGVRFSGKRIQELPKQDLTTLLAEETQVLAVTSSLVVLDCLRHQIKTLEQTVHKRLHHTPSYEQLLTVQGIGPILARTIT